MAKNILTNFKTFYPSFFNLSEAKPLFTSNFDPVAPLNDRHYELEIGVLFSGKLKALYEDSEITVGPGQVWLASMWEPHGNKKIETPADGLVIFFYPPLLARTRFPEMPHLNLLAPFFVPPHQRPQVSVKDNQKRQEIIDLGRRIATYKTWVNPPSGHTMAMVRLLSLELLLTILKDWRRPSDENEKAHDELDRINPAIEMVFNSHGKINVQDGAKVCRMPRSIFCKRFHSLMNMSFGQFGLQYRLQGAATELRQSDVPVKAVAGNWGFGDESHFHRTFVKVYGLSPKAYRERSVHLV